MNQTNLRPCSIKTKDNEEAFAVPVDYYLFAASDNNY
jgi:hypothetical protein